MDLQINNLISEILRIEPIEEAFNCVIVHNPDDIENAKLEKFYKELFSTTVAQLTLPQKENVIRQILTCAATQTNHSQLNLLLDTLHKLVNSNTITARMLCEQILTCEKLIYQNQNFWIACFRLIRKVIAGVDYKGVREIMKICREKLQSFPYNLSSGNQTQMNALYDVIQHIFNRNSCLLPAYFIVSEIQKPESESIESHWITSELIAQLVESFRDTAQMLTLIGHSHMLPVVEHSGYADQLINPWRLDPNTLKFTLKGNLPYDENVVQPQTALLRFVLAQPYSRDMVCSMLNLQKQHKLRCDALEEQIVSLLITAMERSEQEVAANNLLSDPNNLNEDTQSPSHWLWLHLSSQLIYFVLFQFANFSNIVLALHDKLVTRDLKKGRDHLMWVLLQFISGSIQRNPLSNFLPVLKLIDILYTEREALPVPDYNKSSCTYQMSPTCIWIHLIKKALSEHINIPRPIPQALKNHHEFLQHLAMPNTNNSLTIGTDYRITLLCNAYSTNQDLFSRPMATLIDTILQNPKNQNNPSGSSGGSGSNQQIPTVPLSMCILDSLTVHSKMALIHSIVTHIVKQAQTKNPISNVTNMGPALVETYSRLLVYTEIESLGIKGFLQQLLPTVFKSQAWGILYTLLEMFSYRMHHIQPHYRVQLLSHLHSLASVPVHTNQMQLHLCVESTALRLITGLGSAEVQPHLSRFLSETGKSTGSVVSIECEELNRALILTLARSMHITGTGNDIKSSVWCKELLNTIVQHTPHSWAQHTSQCFPPVLNEFFIQHNALKENRQHLKKAVDEEYRKFTSMSNENDIFTHFSVTVTPPLFLCLLFKMIFETDGISAVAYKILDRIGARALSAHLRKLCDYLVFEMANSGSGAHAHVNKCVDTINDMIWKYNIVTIDRLVLCLVLRPHEGSEAQIGVFVIQLLLLKTTEFRNRLSEFVRENSPEHWKQSNWHEKHLSFYQKYPEKFAPDESSSPSLPVFFGNVCLRFLPVLDIVIHRFIEIPIQKVHTTLEVILEHLGCLYKFHDRPVTYLYNTLHYYEKKLRENPPLKKKMVGAVIGSLKDVRPANWALSESYLLYIKKNDTESSVEWIPELTYYIELVRRLVDTFEGKNIFPSPDWRFNEFPNPPVHALYITCVELLGLPVGPQVVANSLLDVMIKGYTIIPSQQIYSWINAIGLIMAALPESYWSVIYDRLQEVMSLPQMINWTYRYSPFDMFNFKLVKEAMLERNYVVTLALAHSIFHHFGAGQIVTVTDYVKDKLKPIIRTEYQLIYLCHLLGPFLQRFENERQNLKMEVSHLLYDSVEQVNNHLGAAPMLYMDPICDLLYHIKYMFIGDSMKTDLEAVIRRLRPSLQMRLRFITHLNIDEIGAEVPDVTSTATVPAQITAPATPQSNQPQSAPPTPQQQQQPAQQQQQQQQATLMAQATSADKF